MRYGNTACLECDELYDSLVGAAYSYRQAADGLEVPTFFGVVYYSQGKEIKEIFNQHGFKQIPYLATSEV